MTFDVMSNSPCFHKGIQGNLEGESSSLSEVTWDFFPALILKSMLELRNNDNCLLLPSTFGLTNFSS